MVKQDTQEESIICPRCNGNGFYHMPEHPKANAEGFVNPCDRPHCGGDGYIRASDYKEEDNYVYDLD